jgi:hypothetical protein
MGVWVVGTSGGPGRRRVRAVCLGFASQKALSPGPSPKRGGGEVSNGRGGENETAGTAVNGDRCSRGPGSRSPGVPLGRQRRDRGNRAVLSGPIPCLPRAAHRPEGSALVANIDHTFFLVNRVWTADFSIPGREAGNGAARRLIVGVWLGRDEEGEEAEGEGGEEKTGYGHAARCGVLASGKPECGGDGGGEIGDFFVEVARGEGGIECDHGDEQGEDVAKGLGGE